MPTTLSGPPRSHLRGVSQSTPLLPSTDCVRKNLFSHANAKAGVFCRHRTTHSRAMSALIRIDLTPSSSFQPADALQTIIRRRVTRYCLEAFRSTPTFSSLRTTMRSVYCFVDNHTTDLSRLRVKMRILAKRMFHRTLRPFLPPLMPVSLLLSYPGDIVYFPAALICLV